MSEKTIHPDFPALPDQDVNRWTWPDPLDDVAAAISEGSPDLSIRDVAEVTDYYIEYHGTKWEPGNDGGTELGLTMIARLNDGRWIGVEAWNDYTGWGCQDGSDVYVGTDRADVIANGITNDGRSALGIETVQ